MRDGYWYAPVNFERWGGEVGRPVIGGGFDLNQLFCLNAPPQGVYHWSMVKKIYLLLFCIVCISAGVTTQPSTGSGHLITPVSAAPSSINASNSSAAAAAAEQRRLFSFGRSARQFHPSANNKTKGKKPPSCTLKFVCLSSREAVNPPASVSQKTTLCNMRLGDGSITFNLNEGSDYCHHKILEKYPKLENAGGYELMLHQRGAGDGAGFHPINPPYTPPKLKDISGQAKIYIRPMQRDLCIDVSEDDSSPQEKKEVSDSKYFHTEIHCHNKKGGAYSNYITPL